MSREELALFARGHDNALKAAKSATYEYISITQIISMGLYHSDYMKKLNLTHFHATKLEGLIWTGSKIY
jgi:hypothetical protein